MKVLHCCLAAFYIDNYGYQENILPRLHRNQGHDVLILASTETYLKGTSSLGYVKPSSYQTSDGIPIRRIPYVGYLPHFIARKIRKYVGVTKVLNDFKPDIIFLHDCQFVSIIEIGLYAKEHSNVKIFVDSHTDFINSARGWISRNILHGLIYKCCASYIEKYTCKFFGTLPIRCSFLRDFYGLKEDKIELLPFGADDSLFNWSDRSHIRDHIRREMQFTSSDFVFITGGKIDARKNIHFLLKAICELGDLDISNTIKLILFGRPSPDLEHIIHEFISRKNIFYLEWLDPKDLHKFFFAADLAIFPGTHSVLWEEAVGMGVPCIFKSWAGIQHVDIGGNCLFLQDGRDIAELKSVILKVVENRELYYRMRDRALKEGPQRFSYSRIARQALSSK